MDNTDSTTKEQKYQHLTAEERHDIEVHLKDGWSKYKIAKHLGRSYNTIKHEIERGTVDLYKGKVKRYKADVGEAIYLEHRQNSRKQYRVLETAKFLRSVVEHFRNDGWSLDACVGSIRLEGSFKRKETVCTRTLYNYVDLGLLPIKNFDLPEKLRRNTKTKKVRENRKNLGKSIEERPKSIETREEFGHWEIDSVIGKKGENEPAAMSIVERKYRYSIWIKLKNHTAKAINETLAEVMRQFGNKANEVFKTITGDNGSEFADLARWEDRGIGVYFTHPYTSCEKGTNECHNRMLRRFIPKGKSMSSYSVEDILFFADMINGLPRKILGYRSPEQLFEAELDRIYSP